MNGWTGKILRVDLTCGEHRVEDLDPDFARKYVGGRGFGAKILLDETDPGVDPLSPENKLVFATGPLTGIALAGSRYLIITKSPLTGFIANANSGGYFGPMMKFAGYDMIIFEGRSEKPVYLAVENGDVSIRPADHLWGKSTIETEDLVKEEVGEPWRARDTRVACIGPAGERMVRFACVMNDKHRAAGRGGIGAVMGSKNLKAVSVWGTKSLTVADEEVFREAYMALSESVSKHPRTSADHPTSYASQGSPRSVNFCYPKGIVPYRNFQGGQNPEIEKIGPETLMSTIFIQKASCFNCPIGCRRMTEVTVPGLEGDGQGPEYEAIALFGSSCDVNDLPAVAKASYICNELGMDTMDMAGTVACAMELFERGYLTEKDVGFPLHFGNAEALVELVRRTGLREGFGDVMAEGGYRMAEKYGHPELFMGVKKQGFAGYDPRAMKGMGLGYATSNRGACHCRTGIAAAEMSDPYATEGKPAMLKQAQDMRAVIDSSGLCMRGPLGSNDTPQTTLSMLEPIVGAGYDLKSMLLAGERIWNLERIYNLKVGLRMEDDFLPPRMVEEPIPDGPANGLVHELHMMLAEYYRVRGWDEKGVHTREKLEELGLMDLGV